jgi:hypothetical protein
LYWIGLIDLFQEGNFTWISSGETATYTNWYSGQPDNFKTIEHFVHLFKDSERTWNDAENDAPEIFALCQYAM